MRSSVNQANQTFGTATGNAANLGSRASTVNSTLEPFLQQRLTNPQGYSQGDLGAMLSNALGSSGGATSGITGQANLEAGRTRNDAGFSGALADAARQRTKANASIASGVATQNADLKQTQQSDAAKMLAGLYGTDVGAQNDALNTSVNATNAATEANKTGWLQNMNEIIQSIGSLGGGAGKFLGGLKGGGGGS